jgi:hypothetical protein
MTTPEQTERRLPVFLLVVRSAAIAVTWLVIVVIATACFFPPWSSFPPWVSNDWDSFQNALAFGSSVATAGAVATALALGIGGKTMWAVEFVIAVASVVALLIAVGCTCLWFDPSIARNFMGHWELERLRATMGGWSEAVVRYEVPLSAVVGLMPGAIAGLVAVLARRRPRIAMALIIALLVAAAAEPVRQLAFGLVLFWGHVVRWNIWSPGMTDPHVPASGATLGAIVGAILAAAAMRLERTRPSASSLAMDNGDPQL